MDSAISYINDRGEYKLAQVPENIADQLIVYDDGLEAYTYVHPVNKTVYTLHSIADRPGLVEHGNRSHWLWNGRLHRIIGPAFSCPGNNEWYVFGIVTNENFINDYKHYLLQVEAFSVANGVDLHGLRLNGDSSRYFLEFKDHDHMVGCAASNTIPIFDRHTGSRHTCNLSELEREVGVQERGPGLLIAIGLAVAAAFTAKKIKKLSESSVENRSKERQVVIVAG